RPPHTARRPILTGRAAPRTSKTPARLNVVIRRNHTLAATLPARDPHLRVIVHAGARVHILDPRARAHRCSIHRLVSYLESVRVSDQCRRRESNPTAPTKGRLSRYDIHS